MIVDIESTVSIEERISMKALYSTTYNITAIENKSQTILKMYKKRSKAEIEAELEQNAKEIAHNCQAAVRALFSAVIDNV